MADVRVLVVDLELAWCRFQAKWPHRETCNWPHFLGCTVMCTSAREGYWATEEGYRKIMLLAGPHWEAVLKVMSVQYRDKLNLKYRGRKHANYQDS